jgi:AbrB family looped-hinge helix DNA binding protein
LFGQCRWPRLAGDGRGEGAAACPIGSGFFCRFDRFDRCGGGRQFGLLRRGSRVLVVRAQPADVAFRLLCRALGVERDEADEQGFGDSAWFDRLTTNGQPNKVPAMLTVTVSNQFRIVIPKAVRERLHIKAGQKLQILAYGQRIELPQQLRSFLPGIDTAVLRS